MLGRGTFNGPGGPHDRWLIPATAGGSMGAEHMLSEKMRLGIVDRSRVLGLTRDGVTRSGVVVATVTAREAPAGAGRLSGITLAMNGGDHDPSCAVATDPSCDGGGYDGYTVEVVHRMGYDSFTPDSGVLLSKTKDRDVAPFIWVIDAHPEDIAKVDFVAPGGTPRKMAIGDYRQLSDALFHAGAGPGNRNEYVDRGNRLHFYVLGIERDRSGILSYTVAIRSLDAGTQRRGVRLAPGTGVASPWRGWVRCSLPLYDTGAPGTPPYGDSDVYRLSATAHGRGWSAWLPNDFATAKAGGRATVTVYAGHTAGAARSGTVSLTAASESDPAKKATTVCEVTGRPGDAAGPVPTS